MSAWSWKRSQIQSQGNAFRGDPSADLSDTRLKERVSPSLSGARLENKKPQNASSEGGLSLQVVWRPSLLHRAFEPVRLTAPTGPGLRPIRWIGVFWQGRLLARRLQRPAHSKLFECKAMFQSGKFSRSARSVSFLDESLSDELFRFADELSQFINSKKA